MFKDCLHLTGPSYAIDTACSSSLLALDHALQAIRSGLCDSAIVGGSSLCLKPSTALQFVKLGMLSPEGSCKSFDASGKFSIIVIIARFFMDLVEYLSIFKACIFRYEKYQNFRQYLLQYSSWWWWCHQHYWELITSTTAM